MAMKQRQHWNFKLINSLQVVHWLNLTIIILTHPVVKCLYCNTFDFLIHSFHKHAHISTQSNFTMGDLLKSKGIWKINSGIILMNIERLKVALSVLHCYPFNETTFCKYYVYGCPCYKNDCQAELNLFEGLLKPLNLMSLSFILSLPWKSVESAMILFHTSNIFGVS